MLFTSAVSDAKCIHMRENQVISLKGRGFEFICIDGTVWITAPAGGDRVITGGQHARVRSAGKICIQAFAPSVIQIRKAGGGQDRPGT